MESSYINLHTWPYKEHKSKLENKSQILINHKGLIFFSSRSHNTEEILIWVVGMLGGSTRQLDRVLVQLENLVPRWPAANIIPPSTHMLPLSYQIPSPSLIHQIMTKWEMAKISKAEEIPS